MSGARGQYKRMKVTEDMPIFTLRIRQSLKERVRAIARERRVSINQAINDLISKAIVDKSL